MSSDHFVEWRSQMSDEAKDEIPRYRRALLRGDGFFHLVPIAGTMTFQRKAKQGKAAASASAGQVVPCQTSHRSSHKGSTYLLSLVHT